MPTIEIKLPHHRYEVRIEPGLLTQLGPLVRGVAPHELATLMVDASIAEMHGVSAQESLEAAGYAAAVVSVRSGEEHKNLETVGELYGALLENKLERRSPVVALGGGVVGDTVGFVAATYLRGVPFIQCPTTLLAMVDASVGGKVGVNMPQGKNLVGCFYQPHLVMIDTETLLTLPARELRCGLAECVKHGVIRSAELFDWIDTNLDAILALDAGVLVELVQRNVRIKADVVMADEKETGLRAHLNFGHTFAHAIEATCGYHGCRHGEAVSLGMAAAATLAVGTGRCDPVVRDRLIALLERIGLPTRTTDLAATTQLCDAMRLDKKVVDGRIRLVLPDKMGHVVIVDDTPQDTLDAAWQSIRDE